jgi:hypothetical protein
VEVSGAATVDPDTHSLRSFLRDDIGESRRSALRDDIGGSLRSFLRDDIGG